MASSPDLFPNVTFSDVSEAAAGPAAEGATAAFGLGAATGAPRLSLVKAEAEPTVEIDLADAQVTAVISVNVILVRGEAGEVARQCVRAVMPLRLCLCFGFDLAWFWGGARCFRTFWGVTRLGFAGI
jgi:hypothetical protein